MIRTLLLCWICTTAAWGAAGFAHENLAYTQQPGQPTIHGRVRKTPGQPAILETAEQNQLNLHELPKIVYSELPSSPNLSTRMAIQWSDAERLMGVCTRIDQASANIRSELGESQIARPDLTVIQNQFVGQVLCSDSFTGSLSGWTLRGNPSISNDRAHTPPGSLKLAAPGESIEWREKTPRPRGRLRLWFYDAVPLGDSRQFNVQLSGPNAQAGEPIILQLGDGREYYTVQLPKSLEIPTLALPRKEGWHSATVEWSPDWFMVLVDDAALVSSFHRGIHFAVQSVTIGTSEPADKAAAEKVSPTPSPVWVDDVTWSTLPDWYRPGFGSSRQPIVTTADQTQLMTVDGDEWFGTVEEADRKQLRFQVSPGQSRSFPWTKVYSVRFASDDTPATPRQWEGEIGKLALQTGDELIVSLISADEKQWVVEHPILKRVTVPLSSIESWTPNVVGRRVELRTQTFHLGSKFVADFPRPYPDGTTLELPFESAAGVGKTRLCLLVRGMEPQLPWAPFESVLKQGGLRTEVWLNGEQVDYLNRHLQHGSDAQQAVCMELPQDKIRTGQNKLELRLQPDPGSKVYDDSEVSVVAIEQEVDPRSKDTQ